MPYAARLLEVLAGAGSEVGLCISDAGIQVLATELYDDPRLARDAVYERLLAPIAGPGPGAVRVFDPGDFGAPYASGSALVDGYVICPCSMGSAGRIAAEAGSNLIHRAASVALKEGRKLVLVPRETPLSLVQLEALATLRRAGAVVLPAAPSFYGRPRGIGELVDTVVARILDQLEIGHELGSRWGEEEA